MIIEDYVSYEIAKLLKEKGFDGWCDYFYDDPRRQELRTKNGEDKYWNGHLWNDEYAAPTHQMAMKWLREVHKIFISIGIGDDIDGVFGYMAEIYCLEGLSCPYGEYRYIPNVDADTISDKTATTYEEAVEAVLRYSLENLI